MAISCYHINKNSFQGLQISNLNTQELLMHFHTAPWWQFQSTIIYIIKGKPKLTVSRFLVMGP